jgi:hypothetical protein
MLDHAAIQSAKEWRFSADCAESSVRLTFEFASVADRPGRYSIRRFGCSCGALGLQMCLSPECLREVAPRAPSPDRTVANPSLARRVLTFTRYHRVRLQCARPIEPGRHLECKSVRVARRALVERALRAASDGGIIGLCFALFIQMGGSV